MTSANIKTTNVGQPREGVNLSRQLSVLCMQSYCALPFIQLFVTALSRCWCCAGTEASSGGGGLARLDIPEEVVKGSRQHLANRLWAMPTLELVTSGHLHAKAMKERASVCNPQKISNTIWAFKFCQTGQVNHTDPPTLTGHVNHTGPPTLTVSYCVSHRKTTGFSTAGMQGATPV